MQSFTTLNSTACRARPSFYCIHLGRCARGCTEQEMPAAVMRTSIASSRAGISPGLPSFLSNAKSVVKLNGEFLQKFEQRSAQTFSENGSRPGGFIRSMRATASDGGKLEGKGSQIQSPSFRVTEVPPIPKGEWYAAPVTNVEDLAPGIRCIVVEAECSREDMRQSFLLVKLSACLFSTREHLVELSDAYTKPGQLAQVKLRGGDPIKVPISSPPFPTDFNLHVHYKFKGDIPAGCEKLPDSTLSVRAPLHLHVTQSDSSILYALREGDDIELGPFEPTGLDLRPIMFVSGFPTMLFFASGRGIAVACAIIEAKGGNTGGLSLGFREEVRLYYSAPDPNLLAYRGKFAEWEEKGVKVRTVVSSTEGKEWGGLVGSFATLWDEDDIEYDPSRTAAVVCVEDNARSEMMKLLSDAEIPEKQAVYWDAL